MPYGARLPEVVFHYSLIKKFSITQVIYPALRAHVETHVAYRGKQLPSTARVVHPNGHFDAVAVIKVVQAIRHFWDFANFGRTASKASRLTRAIEIVR